MKNYISIQTVNKASEYSYLAFTFNRNTRTRCEICSKLTIKTPERVTLTFFLLNTQLPIQISVSIQKSENFINFPVSIIFQRFKRDLPWLVKKNVWQRLVATRCCINMTKSYLSTFKILYTTIQFLYLL